MGRLKGRGLPPRLKPLPSRLKPLGERDGRSSGDARRSDGPINTARWQRLRLAILRRDAVDISGRLEDMPMHVLFKREPLMWPVCQQTGVLLVGGKNEPNSPVVDHIEPHRGDLKLFWDKSNLQSVSKEWHDKTKQSLEKRGLA